MPHVIRISVNSSPVRLGGPYLDIAVLDVSEGFEPRAISSRLKGVRSIVSCDRRVHYGKAASRSVERAIHTCRKFNGAHTEVLVFAGSSYAHPAIKDGAEAADCAGIVFEARHAFVLTSSRIEAAKAALADNGMLL